MRKRRSLRSIVEWRSASAVALAVWCLALDRRDGSVGWSAVTAAMTVGVLALHVSLRGRQVVEAG
jgi:hypothetical protein